MRIATDADEVEFEKLYAAALPPPVRILFYATRPGAIPTSTQIAEIGPDVKDAALELCSQGYLVHAPVVVFGQGAYRTAKEGIADGYRNVPNADQPPVPVAPGLSQPGQPSYNPDDPNYPIMLTLDMDLLGSGSTLYAKRNV
jgi:hypothetical protein